MKQETGSSITIFSKIRYLHPEGFNTHRMLHSTVKKALLLMPVFVCCEMAEALTGFQSSDLYTPRDELKFQSRKK